MVGLLRVFVGPLPWHCAARLANWIVVNTVPEWFVPGAPHEALGGEMTWSRKLGLVPQQKSTDVEQLRRRCWQSVAHW